MPHSTDNEESPLISNTPIEEEVENVPIIVDESEEIESEVEEKPTSAYPTISTPTAQEVYSYGQRLFNTYTNNGNNYDPEVHDDLVMRETAKHFGISVSEAESLYYKGAFE